MQRDTTDPGARLAAILRKPRHLGRFDLAVRTAQWSLWGRKPDQDRGGTGRGRTGGGAGWGVRTGRVLPGESAGPAPTAVRRRRGPTRGRCPDCPDLCGFLTRRAWAGGHWGQGPQAPSREKGRRGPADGAALVVDEHRARLPPPGPVLSPQHRPGADRSASGPLGAGRAGGGRTPPASPHRRRGRARPRGPSSRAAPASPRSWRRSRPGTGCGRGGTRAAP